jgi:hypothetical protein
VHAGWVGLYVARLPLPARFTQRSGNRGLAVTGRQLRRCATGGGSERTACGAQPEQLWRPAGALAGVVCGRSAFARRTPEERKETMTRRAAQAAAPVIDVAGRPCDRTAGGRAAE